MGLGKEISQFSRVLQFEGPVDSLVWKNPIEDFNTTSVLVVDDGRDIIGTNQRKPSKIKGSQMI